MPNIKRLFIAEKPELALAIAEGLGNAVKQNGYYQCNQDVVTYCFGHLIELYDPHDYDPKYKKWNMDHLPMSFIPWKYKPIKGKEDQVKIIKQLVADSEIIVNAGDPDDEGQLLIDELLEYFNNKKPVKRILVNDYNESLVQKAIKNIQDNNGPIFVGMRKRALARQVADQLFGYNLSRGYTINAQKSGHQGTLTVGRVQTPILGLVVNRDRLFESHKASYYYLLTGDFSFNDITFKAKYQVQETDPIDDKKRITDLKFIQDIANQCSGKPAQIVNFESEIKQKSPPLPYNLLKLQVDCNNKFNYRPDQVKDITQRLREKFKLITYNRSDSQYLSDEQHEDAPEILSIIGETCPLFTPFIEKSDSSLKSRAFNSKNVTAHHAIIPTKRGIDISTLDQDERNVYLLIVRAYVAQFLEKQEYRETKITVSCEGHQFNVTSKENNKLGWLALYQKDKNDEDIKEEADTDQDLSTLENTTDGHCIKTDCESKKTKPLPRYTLATLLKDLTRVAKYITDPKLKQQLIEKDSDKKGEHGGIGTPATRDSIIKGLIDRAFLSEEGKTIISTKVGRDYYDLLPDAVKKPDMTALWHSQQTKIADGELELETFLNEIIDFISVQIEDVKTGKIKMTVSKNPCPECDDGHLIRRPGQKPGVFWWGCSNYPECKATFFDKDGKPIEKEKEKTSSSPVSTEHKCPECDKGLVRRKGKKGNFWGCSGFPNCKFTAQDKNGKPIIKEPA